MDPEEPSLQPIEPEPSGPPRRGRDLKRLILSVALIGLVYAAFRVPVPIFYAYLPGPVRDIQPLVEVTGEQTYSSEGTFYLTTVSVDTSVTFAELIGAIVNPDQMVISKADLVPEGTSLKDLEEQQRVQMTDSKRHAEEVAFAELGLGKPTGDGARVVQTAADYPAADVLEVDDVIVEVNGRPVETTCEVGNAIDRLSPGDEVRLTVRRDGRTVEVVLEAVQNPQDPSSAFIGVHMADVNYEFDPGVEVEIATGEIAGPSAGFMFALALYDLLTPEDLTGGRGIAGTGTIACDGGVGPIGGISQKVAGAENRGAEVFLSPAGNYPEAQAAAENIEVVSVSNFSQAVEYLEGLSD